MGKIVRLSLCLLFSVCLALPAEGVKVVTINAWSGLTYSGVLKVREYEDPDNRMYRRTLLGTGLAALAPDLVAVNEANLLPDYAYSLSAELSLDQIHHVRVGGVRIGPVGLPVNLREGDVILAHPRLSLVSIGSKQLSGWPVGNTFSFQAGDASQVVGGKILVAGREVYVFTTRWHVSEFERRDAFVSAVDAYFKKEISGKELADFIEETSEGVERRMREAKETLGFVNAVAGVNPVILMASCNAPPDSEEVKLILGGGFSDAFLAAARKGDAGFTWDEAGNAAIRKYLSTGGKQAIQGAKRERVDYIFIRGDGLTVKDARVVLTEETYGMHPSTHFGVYAEIDIR